MLIFTSINRILLTYQLQKPFVVHLLIGDVLAIVENSIGGNGRRGTLGLFLALQMDGFEKNSIVFGNGLDDGNILAVERALAGVIEYVSRLVDMRMPGAFLKSRRWGIFGKRQIPQLDAVIGLVAYGETFVLQELRIG